MIRSAPPVSPASLRVRQAAGIDRQALTTLLSSNAFVHRHLDWRAPLEWIGEAPYLLLEQDGHLSAVLACPADPASIHWIRLFAHASHLSGPSAWFPLWEAAQQHLAASRSWIAAAIATQDWFETLLVQSGFSLLYPILFLRWEGAHFIPTPLPLGTRLRGMKPADLPRAAEVDAAAFEPLWHTSLSSLRNAFSQALYASVVEDASGVIAYQISTAGSWGGVHLARLAVLPEAQQRGLGSALLSDLMLHIRARGWHHITLNTQANNAASLALYRKFGFRPTGEEYPVYVYAGRDSIPAET